MPSGPSGIPPPTIRIKKKRHNNYLALQSVKSRAKQFVITSSGGASVNSILLMKIEVRAVISIEIMVLHNVTPCTLVGRYQLYGVMHQKKMEATSFCKMLVPALQTTHRHILETIILIFVAART
jgi:hypothetical protein